jgi:hypothetical protein
MTGAIGSQTRQRENGRDEPRRTGREELRRDKIAAPGDYFVIDTGWLMDDPGCFSLVFGT